MFDKIKDENTHIDLSHGSYSFIVPSVSIIYRKFQIFLNDELKKENILPSEFPFLMVMIEMKEEDILQDELIKLLGVTKSVATRVLQTLEEKGFVYRIESAHSKRHKLIKKTDKIHGVEGFLRATHKKWFSIISKSFSDNELEQLSFLLKKSAMNAISYKTS